MNEEDDDLLTYQQIREVPGVYELVNLDKAFFVVVLDVDKAQGPQHRDCFGNVLLRFKKKPKWSTFSQNCSLVSGGRFRRLDNLEAVFNIGIKS